MAEPKPPEECAQCGTAIPRRARACPECGADERTGWREASIYDGLDLPDSAWDTENPGNASSGRMRRINGVAWPWWVVGLLLVGLLVLGMSGLL
jgi:hypothetical protein